MRESNRLLLSEADRQFAARCLGQELAEAYAAINGGADLALFFATIRRNRSSAEQTPDDASGMTP